MRKILFFVTILFLSACGGHNHSLNENSHEHTALDATVYSDSLELFVRYDELVAGHTASVTAYVTSLPSFKPYEGGAIEVSLIAGKNNLSLVSQPQHKGVYNFTLSPESAGVGNLVFLIGKEKLHVHVHVEGGAADEHGHDHAHEHSHAHEAHSNENNIFFSKEQSWKIDFATAPAAASAFNGAVKVAARVSPTPDNFTTLVATASGKVRFIGNVVEGSEVEKGEAIFFLEGSGVTENDAAVKFAEAESNYMVAKADYERKSALFNDNIVSQRDYEAAEAAFKQAEARYHSMKRSFSAGRVTINSSIDGCVSSLLVGNGDYVQAGTPLAVVQRDGDINISAELPVRQASLLKNISAINVELADGTVYAMQDIDARLVASAASANACSMLPLTVTARAIKGLVSGSVVTLYLASELPTASSVVVPREALVEEMGNLFVFVQHTPESFEKRKVLTGATDGIMIQIVKGLNVGERIVTKGAVSLKLSQGAAALDPHAGHVH